MLEDLISVIVPVFNVNRYLKKCVDSITSQSFSNLEIIIVDDGSTDDSGKIADELQQNDGRIRVFHKPNGGLSSARNFGIDVAKGRYLAFVDSDDYLEHDFLKELYCELKYNNAEISICGVNYVLENGKRYEKHNKGKRIKMNFREAFQDMCCGNNFDMAVWNKLFDASLFSNIRFPVGKLSEDYYILYKLIEKANVISFTPLHLYNYLQRKNSISNNKKINFDFLYAALEQLEYIEKKYKELYEYALFATCSSYLTVYDFHLKSKVKPTQNFVRESKNYINKNLKYLIERKFNFPDKKRFQFRLFVFSKKLYDLVFITYRKVRRFQ